MKKSLILLVIALSIATQGWGQRLTESERNARYTSADTIKRIRGLANNNVRPENTNTFEVEYDFKTKLYNRNNVRARVNTPITYRIININRLAHTIRITPVDSILSYSMLDEATPPPSLDESKTQVEEIMDGSTTKSLDVSLFVNADLATTAPKNALSEIGLIASDTEKSRDTLLELQGELKAITDTLNRVTWIDNQLQSLATDSMVNQDSISRLSTEKDSLLANRTEETLNKRASQLKDSIRTHEIKITRFNDIRDRGLKKFANDSYKYRLAFEDLMGSYRQLHKLTTLYKELINVAHNPQLTQSDYAMNYKWLFESQLDSLSTSYRDIAEFPGKFDHLSLLYTHTKYNPDLDSLLNYGGKIKLYAHIENMKDIAERVNASFNSVAYESIVNYIKHVIPALGSPENYTITSDPIQAKNDLVVFDVYIRKKNNHAGDAISTHHFRHEEAIRGGVRLDLGLGLAGSFFPGARSYYLANITEKSEGGPDQNGVKIFQKSKNTYSPSVIGMATLGFRTTRYFMWGASAGLGVDIDEGQIELGNFYAGPSLTVGRYKRVTVTGGLAIKSIDMLKTDVFNVNELHLPGITEDDVFAKQHTLGIFLSVTYNLTKGMRDIIKPFRFPIL